MGRDHVSELDGEEDEDSWVAQMYGYWTGAIWLVMYTDSDSPWQVTGAVRCFAMASTHPNAERNESPSARDP